MLMEVVLMLMVEALMMLMVVHRCAWRWNRSTWWRY